MKEKELVVNPLTGKDPPSNSSCRVELDGDIAPTTNEDPRSPEEPNV